MNGLKLWAALGFCLCASSAAAHVEDVMNEPDSVYLFSYHGIRRRTQRT